MTAPTAAERARVLAAQTAAMFVALDDDPETRAALDAAAHNIEQAITAAATAAREAERERCVEIALGRKAAHEASSESCNNGMEFAVADLYDVRADEADDIATAIKAGTEEGGNVG